MSLEERARQIADLPKVMKGEELIEILDKLPEIFPGCEVSNRFKHQKILKNSPEGVIVTKNYVGEVTSRIYIPLNNVNIELIFARKNQGSEEFFSQVFFHIPQDDGAEYKEISEDHLKVFADVNKYIASYLS